MPVFPKSISPKVNVIARLEFELVYYVNVQHAIPNSSWTSLQK